VCIVEKYKIGKVKSGKTQEIDYWEDKHINMQGSIDKIPQNVWQVCTVKKYKTGQIKSSKTQETNYWEAKYISM